MFVWLDDVREKPNNFDFWAKTPEEAIQLLETGIVAFISLDHDLGLENNLFGEERSGYTVAKWIEQKAYEGKLPKLSWSIHSANPVGRNRMEHALKNADKFWNNA